MNKTIALISFAVAASASTAAMAQFYPYTGGTTGPYIGASFGALDYYEEALPTMTPTVGLLRAGEQFNPYFAVEGRLGTTLSGGGTYAYDSGYHVNAQVIYNVVAKGILPINPWFSGYAIAGLGGAQWHRNYPTFNSADAGLSFGVGAEFNTGGALSFDLEWARLTNGVNTAEGFNYGYSADMLTVGFNWHL
jgi:hypothetical protein